MFDAIGFHEIVLRTPEASRREVCGIGIRDFVGDKQHRYGIDTVASLLVGKTFVEKDMTQMRSALVADDFGTHTVGIGQTLYGTLYLVVERWPATARIELIFRPIQWRIAPTADVGTRTFVVKIFATKRAFGIFVDDNTLFFGSKIIVLHYFIVYFIRLMVCIGLRHTFI